MRGNLFASTLLVIFSGIVLTVLVLILGTSVTIATVLTINEPTPGPAPLPTYTPYPTATPYPMPTPVIILVTAEPTAATEAQPGRCGVKGPGLNILCVED